MMKALVIFVSLLVFSVSGKIFLLSLKIYFTIIKQLSKDQDQLSYTRNRTVYNSISKKIDLSLYCADQVKLPICVILIFVSTS